MCCWQFGDAVDDHRAGVPTLCTLTQLTSLTISTRPPTHAPFTFSDVGLMFLVRYHPRYHSRSHLHRHCHSRFLLVLPLRLTRVAVLCVGAASGAWHEPTAAPEARVSTQAHRRQCAPHLIVMPAAGITGSGGLQHHRPCLRHEVRASPDLGPTLAVARAHAHDPCLESVVPLVSWLIRRVVCVRWYRSPGRASHPCAG